MSENIVKQVCKELGITQKEFAIHMEISKSAVCRLESVNSKNSPSNRHQ